MKRWILIFSFLLAAAPTMAQDQIRKSIYFGGGSYYIDELQTKQLSNWVDSIPNLLDKYEIQLISHTDPNGGKEYNAWLSEMRGNSVFELLKHFDIPERIIHRKDWGLENPVYSNDSFQGMIMNRRVDVILHPIVF
ncbi:MAG TPA: OmpA family protein [Cyclobacteriaceae bacterium]|nr:OmpA family protein [Cyclobacteriaceae bacterium]